MKQIAQNAKTSGRSLGEYSPGDEPRKAGGPVGNDPNLAMTLAEGLASQKKWDEAYKQYHSVIEVGDSPVIGKAYLGAGRCLYEQDEFVRCVQLLTGFISHDPKSPQMGEVLMYMGLCYQKMGDVDKARAFYSKAQSKAAPARPPGTSN
jgi:TolA-binding protein